ncbi:hypothetical protein C8R43DRAFT_1233360 [Mycena crocata]|nr:hypothetical protein C8R43DRAFT_1233360 [Mycena crocata]
MADYFPDEIVSEILTPALRVADELFSHTSTKTSPFAAYGESTSALLLVCKSWFRVATPLLYNVVILRSTGQAKALDAALKKAPELGRFIKKLRVEGGFGTYMHGILKNAPNITELFISVHLRASDSSSELVLGLGRINPTRVIIWDDDESPLKNKSVGQLITALEDCAARWSNMTTVVLPYELMVESEMRRSFILTMCEAPSVTLVSFPIGFLHRGLPVHIRDLAENHSIPTIEIRIAQSAERADAKTQWRSNPLLKSTFQFLDIRERNAAPLFFPKPLPVNPTFRPMFSSPQATVDLVWNRVLFFALDLSIRPTGSVNYLNEQQKHFNLRQLRYLLVCKIFYRLALPYLYQYPFLVNRYALQAFAARLTEEPSLGRHLRELTTHSQTRMFRPNILSPIFAHTPYLTRLVGQHCIGMNWTVFRALAEVAGATLVELAVSLSTQPEASDVPDPTVFSRFTALQTLTWDGSERFASPPGEENAAVRVGLPALEWLTLKTCNLYTILTDMDLPCLRRVNLRDGDEAYPFLNRHGDKIREITATRPVVDKLLALCPMLNHFEIYLWNVTLSNTHFQPFSLRYPPQHHALQKIVLHKHFYDRKSEEDADWNTVFSSVQPAHFPALREIRVAKYEWPTTELAISKSPLVKWAEQLFPHGIKVTDDAGVHWRPRLKTRARR